MAGDCEPSAKTRTAIWGVANWIDEESEYNLKLLYDVNEANHGKEMVGSASIYDNLNWLIPGSPGGHATADITTRNEYISVRHASASPLPAEPLVMPPVDPVEHAALAAAGKRFAPVRQPTAPAPRLAVPAFGCEQLKKNPKISSLEKRKEYRATIAESEKDFCESVVYQTTAFAVANMHALSDEQHDLPHSDQCSMKQFLQLLRKDDPNENRYTSEVIEMPPLNMDATSPATVQMIIQQQVEKCERLKIPSTMLFVDLGE